MNNVAVENYTLCSHPHLDVSNTFDASTFFQ